MICSCCGPTTNSQELKAGLSVGQTPEEGAPMVKLSFCDVCAGNLIKFLLDEYQRKLGVMPRVMLEQFISVVNLQREQEQAGG